MALVGPMITDHSKYILTVLFPVLLVEGGQRCILAEQPLPYEPVYITLCTDAQRVGTLETNHLRSICADLVKRCKV